MKDVAKKFIETYINIYQINIRDVNDQERLLKDLSELELDDCLLFMKKHEIQEKRFVYFHKAIMEEYQRCLKRLKRELLDNKRKEINELIDHAKWERNYGKLDYWYQKIMKTKKEEKKVLTKKQLEDIRKLETKKRVMDYTLPQKVEMVEKHKDVSQMGLNDKIFKAKPKFSKRNSWVRRNLIKCATVLTTMLAIPSLLGYAKKNNDYEKKTHINQMNFLDNNLINDTIKKIEKNEHQLLIKDHKNDFDQELEEFLNTIPSINANYTIKEDAKIHIDFSDSETYYSPLYKEGTLKQNSGYVFLDQEGNQSVITDSMLAYERVKSKEYTYVGNRAINEFSYDELGNIDSYEGLYHQNDIVLIEGEKTLYDEIKEQEMTRTLRR